MREIKLFNQQMHNFMGIRDLEFKPQGRNATLRGDNETFKTSTYSAFLWLLFDKDVYGNSTGNFSIKTTDENDEIIPRLDHSVTGILDIDGTPLILQKIYREKWLKKRKVLTGHTMKYLIDEVPVLKKEYDKRIAEIIPEETFRLLTDINYFNSDKFGWQNRRKILFQLCEGISEKALDAAEKAKKILASKKKTINEKKDGIQPRIDEKERDLAAIAEYNQAEIQARIANFEKQIQDIKTDSTRAVLQKEQAELEAKLSRVEADQEKEKQKVTRRVRLAISDLDKSSDKIWRTIYKTEADIEFKKGMIGAAETEINDLYAVWDKLTEEEPDILDLCPICSKPFTPEEKESVQTEFNLSQSKKKEAINETGKKASAKKEKSVAEKIELEVTLKQEQINLDEIGKDLDKKKAKLEDILSPAERPKGDAEKVKIRECIAEIKERLEQEDQEQDTEALEFDLAAERAKIAKVDAMADHKARIVELGEQEKALSAEIERLEADLFRAEENIQEQARLLEVPINAKFGRVRFQLFEKQMNEGVRPCCITLIDGIPYGHGLNKGNEINAGLDIIKTLSQHYGIQAPVFIDNCESISYPIDPGCQCFKLIKVKDMEKLEITYK